MYHEDLQGADHPKYTKRLNRALNSYLNKAGFDEELQHWFEFPIVATRHDGDLIEGFLEEMLGSKVV